jgi:signal transduction histidine kinase
MRQEVERDDYQAWLWGEILLLGLLCASFALFATYETLQTAYESPELRLVMSTVITLAGGVVALLAGARFAVEGRRSDLCLSCGFFVGAVGTVVFAIAPSLDGDPVGKTEGWADILSRLVGFGLIAAAPFVRGRIATQGRTLQLWLLACTVAIAVIWGLADSMEALLAPLVDPSDETPPLLLTFSLAIQAMLALVALVGFGLRFRAHGEDLDRWLALGATFLLFTALVYVFTPLVSTAYVSQGDFLRVLGYAVLLVGVWRAIRSAEFGRTVAEERARVAREIHDGLAQYLFAVSTHTSMLENGADPEKTIPRLKEAAALAQQEARFAVLALSSASGNAPFDAALRRYVEFLTADGTLEVDLEIRPIALAPDEQIEVFRIVQEGLANVRKHAAAKRTTVHIGMRNARRVVLVRDDGAGFEPGDHGAGQGLKNIRQRAESIGGSFELRSRPGRGTELEVALRA